MLNMKRNVQFEIEVKVGTNVEMKDDVFIAEVSKAILKAEQAANAENIRFHFTMGPTTEDKDPMTDDEKKEPEKKDVEVKPEALNLEAKKTK